MEFHGGGCLKTLSNYLFSKVKIVLFLMFFSVYLEFPPNFSLSLYKEI